VQKFTSTMTIVVHQTILLFSTGTTTTSGADD
jgi:hypothetical protein